MVDGAPAVDAAQSGPTGRVDFVYRVVDGSWSLSASFEKAPAKEDVVLSKGGCTVKRYARSEEGDVVDVARAHASAGKVSVSGGDPALTEALEPASDGSYEQRGASPTSERVFAGGEAVTFRAAGDAVPAFDIASAMPLALHLEEPTLTTTALGKAGATLKRTQDLPLSWSRGAAGVVLVAESMTEDTDKNVWLSLSCELPSEPGTATIDREVLAALPPSSVIRLYSVNVASKAVGDFTVTTRAGVEVVTFDTEEAVEFDVP